MSREKLIKEAKLKYPVGSKFKDLVHGETFTVGSHHFESFGDAKQLYIDVEPHQSRPNKSARVYFGGKWAETIQQLIPGRWYKNLGLMREHTAKFDHISLDGCFISDGTYITDGKFIKITNEGRITTFFNNAQECSIDEIRHILPSDHIDKKGVVRLTPPEVKSKTNMEMIQEECKRRFPIGCTYVSVSSEKEKKLILDTFTYTIQSGSIYAHHGGGYLYKNGEYAQVVTPAPEVKPKSKMEMAQDECKRRFPIGCKYISTSEMISGGLQQTLREDSYTYRIVDETIYAHGCGGFLYDAGRYAQVVTPDIEMSEVQAECKRRFPIGCKYIDAHKAITSGITLRSDRLTYSINGNQIYAHDGGGLLYAYGEYAEIVGDTGIKDEFAVGRYVKCIKKPLYTCWTVGNYYQIVEVIKPSAIRITDDSSDYGTIVVESKYCFELMPEGFFPTMNKCLKYLGENEIVIGSSEISPQGLKYLTSGGISEVAFRRIGDRSRTTVTLPNLIEEVSFKRINK